MTLSDHPQSETSYRWVVLTLGALTHTIVVAIPSMAMPVLFKEISEDLGLSLVQVGAIWGMGSLTGILTGLIGGTIGDRYGTKPTLMIACFLTGIAGALRGLTNSFTTLSLVVLLYGFLTPAIPTNVHKVCGIWFSKKQLGLANGVVAMGMALGFMIGSMISATVMSPLLGGWRNVLILYGALAVLMGVLWHFTRSSPQELQQHSSDSKPFSPYTGFFHVVRIKRIWLLGLVLMGFGGCIQGFLGYLPLYLREIGWREVSADGALASFHAFSMVFVIPLALLSDRLARRKTLLIFIAFVTTLGVGFLSIANDTMVWSLVILTGLFRDGFMAIFMTTVIETRNLGRYTLGTALGLVRVLSSIGGLISPPLGNSLARINLGAPFLFWGGLAAMAFITLLFVKE
jgi:DHA1 family multidrug resistance protein-like MFS transporter